jgi:MFS transporter, DHA2 family, multidrug resistance protein
MAKFARMTDTQRIIPAELHPLLTWAGFVAMCLGMFMAILDIQVVVTSLPTIEKELKIGIERISWIQTAYIIAEVIAIPLTGLLIRVFSMRWLFVGALAAFTLASIGCAQSGSFHGLLAWRVAQGFAGGVLIPLVFSGIFLLFPKGLQQTLATGIGGVLAVLAPTLGPLVGGWLTQNYSWPWLFLINVPVGLFSVALGLFTLPRDVTKLHLLRTLDYISLTAFGASLALLVVGLKEAPQEGWTSAIVLGYLGVGALAMVVAVKRRDPAIMFHLLRDRALAYGCALSFLLGMILFASTYLLPLFFGFVKGLGAFDIGIITVTMGIAQLAAAPITVAIDRFFNARSLTALGFVVFGIGLVTNAQLTVVSTDDAFYWPQIIRGISVALCILPPIRFALALIPIETVNDASGLFNLMRNIGGVIGIALTDTLLFSRAPIHAEKIVEQITSSPAQAAERLGLNVADLPDMSDPTEMMNVGDLVQVAGLAQAMNEAWLGLGVIAMLALPLLWMMGPVRSALPVKALQAESNI